MTITDKIQAFAHRHGTILATERHGQWVIIYTRGGYAEDGNGMAFNSLGALADWLGY
jgi:hypothetical protein